MTASTTAINNTVSGVDLIIEGISYTVDGQGTSGVRPFTIMTDTVVSMQDITITGGNVTGALEDGGGILNHGNLTLNNSTVSDNTVEELGGGIFNAPGGGTMIINNSTISGNSSTTNVGGGVSNAGIMTMTNSTVSGNSADSAVGHGGGVRNAGILTIDSSTLSGNSSTKEGSALHYQDGSVTVRNSILANSGGNVDCAGSFGSIFDGGHNLVETTHPTCPFVDGVNNTIVGQDPVLGSLADNGGKTLTHALLPGSPAIDAGDTTLTIDQRGESRPAGVADDIGAYEAHVASIAVLGNNVSIANGDTTPDPADFTDFGNVNVGDSFVRTFTILNNGASDLMLNGTPTVAIDNNPPFSITAQPVSTTLAHGQFTTFDVTFAPTATGVQTATITIASDDPNDNPFVFTVHGTADAAAEVTVDLKLLGMSISGFTPGPINGYTAGTFNWNWTVQNANLPAVSNVYYRVIQLSPPGVAVVDNADGGPAGQGAQVSVPNGALPGGDDKLDNGEQYTQLFKIGWNVHAAFTFQVQAFGTIIGTPLAPGSSEPQLLQTFTVEFDPSMVDVGQPEEGSDKPNKLFLPILMK